MNPRVNHDLRQVAVAWLARLPFLSIYDLSKLLNVSEPRVQRALSELETRGWCEWIATSSSEPDERRLFVLTDAAQNRLAELKPTSMLPIGRGNTLAHMQRLETVVGLNRFLSELVAAMVPDVELDGADARMVSWRARNGDGCVPPDVEAYVRLKWGYWSAPAFVAWDRAAAPEPHRRKRVAGWYAYALTRGWDTMFVLIICPGELQADQWARAIVNK